MERPDTTYNDKETSKNDLKCPEMIYKEQNTTYSMHKTTWNDLQRVTFEIFLQYGTIHCFVKIIDKNKAPNVHTLSYVLITVHKIYNMRHKPLETCKLTFAMQKPALWIKLDIKIKFWRRLNIPGLWKWLLSHLLPKFHHHFHFTSSDFY